jgi:hypothetical protein
MALGDDRTPWGGWALIAAGMSLLMIGSELVFVLPVWYPGNIQLTTTPRIAAVWLSAFFSLGLGITGMTLGYLATNANVSQRTGRAWLGFVLSALCIITVLTLSWVIYDLRLPAVTRQI